MIRIGYGSDTHRLVSGKRLLVGGVEIDSEFGADGHSDADVLLHAITDAILGAFALGDIGTHFSNSDDRWRDQDSFVFLTFAVEKMRTLGYSISNIDSTVHLERPKLAPIILEARKRIALAIGIDESQISIKAKTGEGVDAVGEGRAIRAEAIVSCLKIVKSETE